MVLDPYKEVLFCVDKQDLNVENYQKARIEIHKAADKNNVGTGVALVPWIRKDTSIHLSDHKVNIFYQEVVS